MCVIFSTSCQCMRAPSTLLPCSSSFFFCSLAGVQRDGRRRRQLSRSSSCCAYLPDEAEPSQIIRLASGADRRHTLIMVLCGTQETLMQCQACGVALGVGWCSECRKERTAPAELGKRARNVRQDVRDGLFLPSRHSAPAPAPAPAPALATVPSSDVGRAQIAHVLALTVAAPDKFPLLVFAPASQLCHAFCISHAAAGTCPCRGTLVTFCFLCFFCFFCFFFFCFCCSSTF
jgi:hypothetical protein